MTKSQRRTRHGADTDRGDVNAGGDVVGGDKIQAGRDIVHGDVVTVSGLSPKAVQRLLITVGVMVFVTAACFFSGGVIVGAAVLNSFERQPADSAGRPTDSTLESAMAMKQKIDAAQALPQGTQFQLPFSEVELSSYIRFLDQVGGTRLGLSDGKVRFIEPGVFVVGGQLDALGGLPVAATFEFSDQAGTPIELRSAAVQIIRVPDSSFGWVAIPTALVRPFADRITALLNGIHLTQIAVRGAQWTAFGVKQ